MSEKHGQPQQETVWWCWTCRRPVSSRELASGKHTGLHALSPMKFMNEAELLATKDAADRLHMTVKYGRRSSKTYE
jgi:hypothetical protein